MFDADRVLIVDAGNTCIKYTAFCGEVLCWQVRDQEWIERKSFYPDFIYIASVRSAEQSKELFASIQSEYPKSRIIELISQPVACGVRCAYEEPWRLGIDRWLTVVSTYHRYQSNAVIIDAGTAIKVDIVSQSAHHLGGYIVPGLAMMENALLAKTARIRYDDTEKVITDGLPNSTARAVTEGCHEMALGFLQRIYQRYHDFRWIVTGGDGLALLRSLSIEADYEPYLVAHGALLVGNESVEMMS